MDSMIFFVIIAVLLFLHFFSNQKNEGFDITTDLRHQPYAGKFSDCNLIGKIKDVGPITCKMLCNKTYSCRGASYSSKSPFECRLYNDAAVPDEDPRYVSWFKLKDAKHIY